MKITTNKSQKAKHLNITIKWEKFDDNDDGGDEKKVKNGDDDDDEDMKETERRDGEREWTRKKKETEGERDPKH